MKYSFVVDELSNNLYGICRKGWLAKIASDNQGNIYDQCKECDTCGIKRDGHIWYLTPSCSKWCYVMLDDNGAIKGIKDLKKV